MCLGLLHQRKEVLLGDSQRTRKLHFYSSTFIGPSVSSMSPGLAMVFYVSKNKVYMHTLQHRMEIQPVVDHIISERRNYGVGAALDPPGVLYIECSNLNKMPKQSKGVLAAYRSGKGWRLGYIWSLRLNWMQILVWKGKGIRDHTHDRTVPDFHYYRKDDFLKGKWKDSFEAKAMPIPVHIKFLNQVCGPRPFQDYDWKLNLVGDDKMISCSLTGPDSIVLPPADQVFFKSEGGQIKKVYFGPRPRCKDNLGLIGNSDVNRRPRNRSKRKRNETSARLPPYLKKPAMHKFDSWKMRTLYIEDGKDDLRTGIKDPKDGCLAWPLLSRFGKGPKT